VRNEESCKIILPCSSEEEEAVVVAAYDCAARDFTEFFECESAFGRETLRIKNRTPRGDGGLPSNGSGGERHWPISGL